MEPVRTPTSVQIKATLPSIKILRVTLPAVLFPVNHQTIVRMCPVTIPQTGNQACPLDLQTNQAERRIREMRTTATSNIPISRIELGLVSRTTVTAAVRRRTEYRVVLPTSQSRGAWEKPQTGTKPARRQMSYNTGHRIRRDVTYSKKTDRRMGDSKTDTVTGIGRRRGGTDRTICETDRWMDRLITQNGRIAQGELLRMMDKNHGYEHFLVKTNVFFLSFF